MALTALAGRLVKHEHASLFSRHLSAVRSTNSGSSTTVISYSRTTDRDDDDGQPQQRRRPVAHEPALVVDALRHFHRQHQHFVVPYSFEVPSTPQNDYEAWPEHLRGVKLGRAMRRFVKDLNSSTRALETEPTLEQLRAIGFSVQVTDWKQFHWEQVALSALQSYKAIEGHLRVPRKFVVPENDDRFAKPAWGYKLGAHVNQLRVKRESLTEYQLDALEEIGFIWNSTNDKWANQFLPALRRYRELHGHVNVPQLFTVPSEDGIWSQELWGFALGRMVNQTRSGDIYYPQVERFLPELVALGFSFSSIESTWDEKILPSLQVFRSVHGHCNVSKYFEVPHEAPWPQQAWGTKLGFIVHNIRSRGDFFQLVGRDMEHLEHLGFVWNISEAKWRQRILPSLKAFVQIHGHANIPRSFVVPSKAPWPVKTWGMDLGRVASDRSYQRKYADYIEIERNQLEALGFFWATTVAHGHEDQ